MLLMPNESENIKKEEGEEKPRFEPEKDFVIWSAPVRSFKKRGREFYVTVFAMAALVGLILFVVEGIMPVILIAALLFLFYVLSTVEPEVVTYKITNKGIRIGDRLTEWDFVIRFWFSQKGEEEVLVVETFGLSGRMEILIEVAKKEEIRKTLLNYAPEEKAPATNFDKAAGWISKKIS